MRDSKAMNDLTNEHTQSVDITEQKSNDRRQFIKGSAAVAAGISMGMASLGLSAKSYARVIGANERMHSAVIGVNGRGQALMKAAALAPNAEVNVICDVDSRAMQKANDMLVHDTGSPARLIEDYREVLAQKDVDTVLIATPEHWHAPMALLALQAGKHAYLEKPCSHNPAEGEMLLQAQQKYKPLIQVGTQQRSAQTSIQAVKDIAQGIIDKVYYAKAWYSNNRASIGQAKESPVPEWLNWDLWQGPAPRESFKDIYVHYNWHWFWQYGTGEINNNATHELDIARWAMGLTYPNRVSSSGGRFHFDDAWQFYDTQVVNYEYDDGKMLCWEGRSCNGFNHYDRGRGLTLHGTMGTILLDRNGYTAYNLEREIIKDMKEEGESATTNTIGAGFLDNQHMNNFVAAIRTGEALRAPITEGIISNQLCHLGNYSQAVKRSLNIDPSNGRILNDPEAMKYWSRDYEPGWEMKV
ncbi:Gfo/Idh/MocA family oxidoreductase [Glaciecola siphonariae]|uniref:Gfo/Idh/MocA family oxidoreductase n=1 Tax=Glaciecola siphonariae TaxID=521012 RepID=A0ABV9M2X5_9ALTE